MEDISEEQAAVFKAALSGHNVFISGQAGTGKSFLLSMIINQLKVIGKTVGVTATTGIACQLFDHCHGPLTIHRWSGMNDGRLSAKELYNQLDQHNNDAFTRIQKTDTLILDEASMLSAKMFGILEEICRKVKKTEKTFGGMQLIFSGDFYQLPPVKNERYNDKGEFPFEHHIWPLVFPHTYILKTVHRQNDIDLIKTINEASIGHLSQESIEMIKELERPIAYCHVRKLFATNQEADIENLDRVDEMSGDVMTYKAEDKGNINCLNAMVVPRILHLKKNCPVMLLANLNNKLVNGTMGHVVEFGENGPIVTFPKADITMELKPKSFSGI